MQTRYCNKSWVYGSKERKKLYVKNTYEVLVATSTSECLTIHIIPIPDLISTYIYFFIVYCTQY